MSQPFPSSRRMAILLAACLFLLCPSIGKAQQTAPPAIEKQQGADKSSSGLNSSGSAATSADKQEAPPPQKPSKNAKGAPSSFGQFFKNIAHDQAGIWTSPLRIRRHDALWLIPFAGALAVTIPTDAQALRGINPNSSYVRITRGFSAAGYPYIALGGSAAGYLVGRATHNEHLKETGALGSEAILNSILVVQALKLVTNRERPNQGNGQGRFWVHGFRDFPHGTAFPSGHAAASWALAGVITGEYPDKPLVKVLSYGLATMVSVSRVTGRKHYPSDALVGSVFGFLMGRYVVRHHATEFRNDHAVTISPFTDARSRTLGITVSFSPGVLTRAFGQAAE